MGTTISFTAGVPRGPEEATALEEIRVTSGTRRAVEVRARAHQIFVQHLRSLERDRIALTSESLRRVATHAREVGQGHAVIERSRHAHETDPAHDCPPSAARPARARQRHARGIGARSERSCRSCRSCRRRTGRTAREVVPRVGAVLPVLPVLQDEDRPDRSIEIEIEIDDMS